MGVYVAQMALVEKVLTEALAIALRVDNEISAAILHQFRNVSDRIDVVQDVLTKASLGTMAANNLLSLIPKLRATNKTRNELAHGIYLQRGFEGEVLVRTWASQKRPSREIEVTAAYLDEQLTVVEKLLSDLSWIKHHPNEPLRKTSPLLPKMGRP